MLEEVHLRVETKLLVMLKTICSVYLWLSWEGDIPNDFTSICVNENEPTMLVITTGQKHLKRVTYTGEVVWWRIFGLVTEVNYVNKLR